MLLPVLFLNLQWSAGGRITLFSPENVLMTVYFLAGGVTLGLLSPPRRTDTEPATATSVGE